MGRSISTDNGARTDRPTASTLAKIQRFNAMCASSKLCAGYGSSKSWGLIIDERRYRRSLTTPYVFCVAAARQSELRCCAVRRVLPLCGPTNDHRPTEILSRPMLVDSVSSRHQGNVTRLGPVAKSWNATTSSGCGPLTSDRRRHHRHRGHRRHRRHQTRRRRRRCGRWSVAPRLHSL